MTDTVRVSPSQLSVAMLCWRKWAFAYLLGLREPETWQLALGTRVHAILEAYLRDGTVPDPAETWTHAGSPRTFYPGRIALNMMPPDVFPPPGSGEVEHGFEFVLDGVTWNGKIDWHAFVNFERIVVMDHKTSSDPERWGKLGDVSSDREDYFERGLRFDVQPIIYGRAMLERYGDHPVEAYWNYGSTQGVASKSRVAVARFDPAQLRDAFDERVRPYGEEIRRLRVMNADPLSLDPNPDACTAYRKNCPHVSTCNLSTKERLGNIIMGNPMVDSLIADAQNAGAQPAPTAPQPPAAPGGVNPPEANAPPAPTPPTPPTPPQAPAAPQAPVPPASAPTPPTPPQAPAAPPAPPSPPTVSGTAATGGSGKRGASKRGKGKTSKSDLAPVLAQLAEIRKVDEELADAVAGKIADRIADKLLSDLD